MLVGSASMSDGDTQVLPAPASSPNDHSITDLDLKHLFPSLEALPTVFCLPVSDFSFQDNF